MGMDYHTVDFILSSAVNWENGSITRVLTVGRQNWWLSRREGKRLGLTHRPPYSNTNYSESFWGQDLGVAEIDSVDVVPDEHPTIIADLSSRDSLKLVSDYKTWDVVCEFGTAEHVADQYAFWANLHDALRLDGTLFVVVPCDGLSGHGLYQFSPEFFSNLNGFMCLRCGTMTYGPIPRYREFFAEGRHQTKHKYPTFVFAELRKTSAPFGLPIQQGVTTTHRHTPPLAQLLVEVPGIRILERLFRA